MVSELDVPLLQQGAVVDVTVDALGGARVPGRIRRIFPSADSVTRLVPVEVCIKWGYVVGPPVWVPVAENSPYGRWERPVEKYCLAWYTEHVWVESCEFPELTVVLA